MIYYTKTDEWVKVEGNKATIGLSNYAVSELGDIVFVELPQVGDEFSKGESFGAVESVKAASDIYMPIGGKVTKVNEELEDSPEALNEDSVVNYLIEIEDFDVEELEGLLQEDEYLKDK